MKQDLVFWEEPLAGASFSNIIRLLWQNRFRIHIKYLPRLIYSLVMSAIFTPLRWVEHVRFHPRVRRVKIEKEPVFIIGHYRTGTTYLHMLLAKDRNFGYLSNIEGYLPHTFLAFPRLSEWIISLSLPEKRPMDEFRMVNINPTEEEYSLGGMDKYGYYNGFLFPRRDQRRKGRQKVARQGVECRQVECRGYGVVAGLAEVHMVVGMHGLVCPGLAAERDVGKVGHDLVHVHVG